MGWEGEGGRGRGEGEFRSNCSNVYKNTHYTLIMAHILWLSDYMSDIQSPTPTLVSIHQRTMSWYIAIISSYSHTCACIHIYSVLSYMYMLLMWLLWALLYHMDAYVLYISWVIHIYKHKICMTQGLCTHFSIELYIAYISTLLLLLWCQLTHSH